MERLLRNDAMRVVIPPNAELYLPQMRITGPFRYSIRASGSGSARLSFSFLLVIVDIFLRGYK
jgi:hypothetical protein